MWQKLRWFWLGGVNKTARWRRKRSWKATGHKYETLSDLFSLSLWIWMPQTGWWTGWGGQEGRPTESGSIANVPHPTPSRRLTDPFRCQAISLCITRVPCPWSQVIVWFMLQKNRPLEKPISLTYQNYFTRTALRTSIAPRIANRFNVIWATINYFRYWTRKGWPILIWKFKNFSHSKSNCA